MIACPICQSPTPDKRPGTPYYMCNSCGCWHQSPLPEKVFHGPEEPGVDAMPEYERQVNVELAGHLFHNVMGGKRGDTLDVGAKIPVLAAGLATWGCDAYAMEATDANENQRQDFSFLSVGMMKADFEQLEITPRLLDWEGYRLITLVHTFEHFYDPIAAMRKLRKLVADDGHVFIRLPDHTVAGYERDLSAHHFKIHPFYHSLSSILEILARIGDAFVVESFTTPGSGQRDIVLRPIV